VKERTEVNRAIKRKMRVEKKGQGEYINDFHQDKEGD
jgi:hypothetical protein